MGGIWVGIRDSAFTSNASRVARICDDRGEKKRGKGGSEGLLKFGRAWEKRNS